MTGNESTVWEFRVPGRPQQRGSKQACVRYDKNGKPVTKNGRVLTFARDMNKKSLEWMHSVRNSAVHATKFELELLNGPIVLEAYFVFKRPKSHFRTGKFAGELKPSAPERHTQKPDLAKLLRSLEDALTGVIWRDDSQVFAYGPGTGKYWSKGYEYTAVKITENPIGHDTPGILHPG